MTVGDLLQIEDGDMPSQPQDSQAAVVLDPSVSYSATPATQFRSLMRFPVEGKLALATAEAVAAAKPPSVGPIVGPRTVKVMLLQLRDVQAVCIDC